MLHKVIILILPFGAIATLLLWPFRESFITDRYAEWYKTNVKMANLVGRSAATDLAPPREPTTNLPCLFPFETADGDFGYSPGWGPVPDAWGNAIWLKPVVGSSSLMKFVSLGPNGLDDGEPGDDYVVEVNTDSYLVTPSWPPDVVWPPLPPSALGRAALATPAWVPFLVLAAYPVFVLLRGATARRQLVTGPMSVLFALIAISALVLGVASFLTPISWTRDSGLYLAPRTDITVDGGVLGLVHGWAVVDPPNCVPHRALGQLLSYQVPEWVTEQSFAVFGFEWWIKTWPDPGSCDSLHRAQLRLPLWIPFALSTPLAAGPWLCIARRWRKVRRRRRGLCVNCGYNLTGNISGVCPECGEVV